MIVILVSFVFFSGCTLNFKGKEIELESQVVIQYELESVDFFKPGEMDPFEKSESAFISTAYRR